MQAYLHTVLEPILAEYAETRELYAPEGPDAARGRDVPLPRARRRARALRGRGAGAVLPRRRRGRDRRLGERARAARSARADLAAYEPIAARPGQRPVRGPRGADQPAAVLGRDPDLALPRAARAPRARPRSRTSSPRSARRTARAARSSTPASTTPAYPARFLDPGRIDALAAELRRGGGELGDAGRAPGGSGSTTHITVVDGDGGCASVTCSNGTGLRDAGSRDRRTRQQHARRGGPQPARLPRRCRPGRRMTSMMAPTLVLRDGRARGGARQRRLEPDPLGDPAGHPAAGRRRHGRASRRSRRDGSTSRTGSSRPSPASTPDALARLEARGVRGGALARPQPVLRRRPRRGPRSRVRRAQRRRRPTARRRRRVRLSGVLTRDDAAVATSRARRSPANARATRATARSARSRTRMRSPSERSSSRRCFVSPGSSILPASS